MLFLKTKEDAITGEILNEAIDSIREIKKLDLDFVIVTEKMLEVLKNNLTN